MDSSPRSSRAGAGAGTAPSGSKHKVQAGRPREKCPHPVFHEEVEGQPEDRASEFWPRFSFEMLEASAFL